MMKWTGTTKHFCDLRPGDVVLLPGTDHGQRATVLRPSRARGYLTVQREGSKRLTEWKAAPGAAVRVEEAR